MSKRAIARGLGLALLAVSGLAVAGKPPAGAPVSSLTAYDAVVREGRLYLLSTDQRALVAHALPGLAPLWKRELPGAVPQGSQLTALEPDRLLVWNPGKLYVVSRADGALLAQHADTVSSERSFLWRNGDACGLNRPCSFQPIDCRSAQALGPPIRGARLSFHDEFGSGSTGCYSFTHAPVGATATVAVYSLVGTEQSREPEVIGLDRKTGAVRYRSAAVACAHCSPTALGIAEAAGICWTTSTDDREIVTRAFACETGEPRWTHKQPGAVTSQVVTARLASPQPAVLVSAPGRATLLDAATGKVRFASRIPSRALATVVGARSDASLVVIDDFESIVTLDAERGVVLKTERAPKGGRVALAADGSFRWLDGEIPGETSGQHPPLPPRGPVFRVDRGPASAPATVRVRATSQVALTLPHDGWWLGEVEDGPDVVGVIYAHDEKGPGRIHLVRTKPAP